MTAFWNRVLRQRGLTSCDTVAAMWDSSWFPCASGGERYHVSDDGGAPRCNTHSAILDEGTAIPAKDAPVSLRCQRSGCRQRWPQEEPGA